jgi:hypothetical protein
MLYSQKRLPDHARLIGNAIRWTDPDAQLVQLDEWPVEVFLYRQPDRRRVNLHIVNLANAQTGPLYKVIPLHDLRVRVRTSCTPGCRRVQALVARADVPFALKADWLDLTLPLLDYYEVLVFELE